MVSGYGGSRNGILCVIFTARYVVDAVLLVLMITCVSSVVIPREAPSSEVEILSRTADVLIR